MTKYIFVTGGVVSSLGKRHYGSFARQTAEKAAVIKVTIQKV